MSKLRDRDMWYARVQWALAGGMALLMLGFYVLGYRPAVHRQDSLELQISQKQHELEVNQSEARDLPAVAREVELLRYRLERFGRKLPKQQELGGFVSSIEQLGQQAQLRGLDIFPEMQRRNALYTELPIQLRFEGDFMSVCTFLRQAEEMQRLTRVQQLSMRTKDSSAGQVEVRLLLTIYSEG